MDAPGVVLIKKYHDATMFTVHPHAVPEWRYGELTALYGHCNSTVGSSSSSKKIRSQRCYESRSFPTGASQFELVPHAQNWPRKHLQLQTGGIQLCQKKKSVPSIDRMGRSLSSDMQLIYRLG
jgi:hypothetical protein